jgi:O-antigen/teichoic acid export membrane protein
MSQATLPATTWAERFFVNVIWSWVGVFANFLTGFFLSPYIIRKLGDERYGIWALAFAFIDYFILFDFGFRLAAVNLISRFRIQHEEDRINEVINTSLFYFIVLACGLAAATVAVAGELHRFFQIAPAYQQDFANLVRIIGIGWATAMAFSITIAGLEALQQFKAQNHIYVLALLIRSGGCALALYWGYGLTTMGMVVTVSQLTTYLLSFLHLRRAFPGMRVSPSLARWTMWKDMCRYGVHTFTSTLATILLNQGPPMVIGHMRPTEYVGYYTMPSRLLNYMVELITRIGSVTTPNTSQMDEGGRRTEIVQMGIYLNRYSFALFMPLAAFLLVYGRELVTLWISPEFADQAAALLPPFVLSTSLAVAGQYTSVAILFGLARHAAYSRTLLAEGILVVAGIAWALPNYGLLGAAWVAVSFALFNRAVVTPYLLCRILDYPLPQYLWSIYTRPAVLMAPLVALAYWLHSQGLTGATWIQLLSALGILAAVYYAASWFTVLESQHRSLVQNWISKRLRL